MKRRSLLKAILAAPSYAIVPLAPVAQMRVLRWQPVMVLDRTAMSKGWDFYSTESLAPLYEPSQEKE
jgi:hypothetical protein